MKHDFRNIKHEWGLKISRIWDFYNVFQTLYYQLNISIIYDVIYKPHDNINQQPIIYGHRKKEESKQSTKNSYQITKEEKKTITKQPGNNQQNALSTYLSIIELF